jgi:hypothetical protein
MNAIALAVGFIVILLDDLWVRGELIDKGEAVQVDRAVRNDWIGSKLARDATDEEVEAYRAAEAEAAADAAAEAAADSDADGAADAAGKAGKRAAK